MVELRAVEPGFPYYGRMVLAEGQTFSPDLLANGGALIRPELQAQIGVQVGDAILIGTKRFEIRGLIESEPGRRLGAFSLGPRVFVSLADLRQTGLLDVRQPRQLPAPGQGAERGARWPGDRAPRGLLRQNSPESGPTKPPRTTSARTSRARRTT